MKDTLKKILRIFRNILIGLFLASIVVTLLYRFIPVPVTPLMLIRSGEQLLDGKELRLSKDWKNLSDISPNLVQAVVAGEDNRFMSHFGFDLEAIRKARAHNKNSRTTRGASTISQQTAKNVFLWPQRSWLRKGLEVYFTAVIELLWSKERIMEVYLNVIETGDGIYGAEACSRTCFHKPAKALTKSEAALIAAVLPNPREWNPAKPNGKVRHCQSLILNLMVKVGPVKFD